MTGIGTPTSHNNSPLPIIRLLHVSHIAEKRRSGAALVPLLPRPGVALCARWL